MAALTPEQCIYAHDALHELNPKGWVVWNDFWAMVDRLQTKRPIVSCTAPTSTSIRLTSDQGSQPMYGLATQLKELCSIDREDAHTYSSDDMTDEKWIALQELMTFWGVVLNPQPPLRLNMQQVFPHACTVNPSGSQGGSSYS